MSVGLTRVHEFIARRWIRRKKFLRREPSCQDCAWARAVAWDETRPSCLVHNMCGQNRTKRGCIPHKCPHAGHPAGRADLAQSMRCERALWTKSARGRGKAKRPSSGPIAPDEGRFRLASPNPRFPCKAQRSDRRRPTGLARFRPIGEASFRLLKPDRGFEPLAPELQVRCSGQLSYSGETGRSLGGPRNATALSSSKSRAQRMFWIWLFAAKLTRSRALPRAASAAGTDVDWNQARVAWYSTCGRSAWVMSRS